MASKKRNYTILLVPDDNSRTVFLHVNRNVVRSLVLFLILLTVVVGVLIYFSAGIALKLQLVASLEAENARLGDENQTLLKVGQKVAHIEDMDRYFSRLALETGVTPAPIIPSAAPSPDPSLFSEDSHDEDIGSMQLNGHGELDQNHPISNSEEYFDALPYIRPVDGWITQEFSPKATDTANVHEGIDIGAAQGTPIQATAPGIVSEVVNDPFFGNLVVIRHPFDFQTRYGHCSQILVAPGTHVRRGQTIALVGNTGRSTAPHVHYEVLKNGRPVDPMRYILSHR